MPAPAETLDILMEISRMLNTGLDEETLVVCLRLCENGINPEALSEVIRELRRESASIIAIESGDTTSANYTGRS
ncbi:mitotic-spindle organizing protein 1 [Biomphalaria glabrata]